MNRYNDLELEIESLHREINRNPVYYQGVFPGYWRGLVNFLIAKILIKAGIYQKLVDTGIIRGWFNIFNRYWQEVFNGIPIYIQDFHFLRCYYRMKFQKVSLQEGADKRQFCLTWQRPENIYATFKAVYKLALDPAVGYGYIRYLKKNDRVLEYGCGLAPITQSLIKYFSYKKLDFSIADIRGFPFHYAKYCLKGYGVKSYDIEPYQSVKLQAEFDAIFLITVMEHLPDPEQVIVNLTHSLKKNGLLFFDYILSPGGGLDTPEAIAKREEILRYICANYRIISGEINFKESMGLTIASKL